MECLGSDYERPWSKLSETGPNSKMSKLVVVEVVRVTTALHLSMSLPLPLLFTLLFLNFSAKVNISTAFSSTDETNRLFSNFSARVFLSAN